MKYGTTTCALLVCLLGCHEQAVDQEPIYFSYFHTFVPFMADSNEYIYLIDTGSPRSPVVPAALGLPDDSFQVTPLPDWDIGALNPGDIPIVVSRVLPPMALPEDRLGGIIGADLLSQRLFALDPRTQRFILGQPDSLLFDVEPGVDIPIMFRGGGSTCLIEDQCFDYGPSRLIVEVEIEGQPVYALIDTGATYVMATTTLFERLPQRDDRPSLIFERAGLHNQYSRFATFQIGGVELDNVPFIVREELSTSLARLHIETGIRVEMLLGHSFLMHFVTAIDYPEKSMRLFRYHDQSHVNTDNFDVLALEFRVTESCFEVTGIAPEVLPELALGDCVVKIAEFPFGASDPDEIVTYMQSLEIGDPVSIDVVREGGVVETVVLEVIDLLPEMG